MLIASASYDHCALKELSKAAVNRCYNSHMQRNKRPMLTLTYEIEAWVLKNRKTRWSLQRLCS